MATVEVFKSNLRREKRKEHFTELAKNFDYMYEPFNQASLKLIIEKLQLTPDDLLLDIGAASGQQAHLVWKQVGLKNPVTCVEPIKEFFERASKLDGIVPVIQTAEQFCDHLVQDQGANKQPFNKVILMGVIDHLDDANKRIGQIMDYLPINGILMVTNPPCVDVELPITPLHLENLAKIPDLFDVIIPYFKSRDDVITEVTTERSTFKIAKSRWYYMLRNRFWSSFRRYTDEELEESIKELDNGRFKGVKDDELITCVDKITVLKLTKKL